MEDQLKLLVEKGKAKRAELLGQADPHETATSPTLEVDQIDRHVLKFFSICGCLEDLPVFI